MMRTPKAISLNDLRGQPGLFRAACDRVLRLQPRTVLQALRIHGVGRSTTKRILALGLLTDPEHVQTRALTAEEVTGMGAGGGSLGDRARTTERASPTSDSRQNKASPRSPAPSFGLAERTARAGCRGAAPVGETGTSTPLSLHDDST